MSNKTYVRVSDGYYPMTLAQIKRDHPSVGFPPSPRDEEMLTLGPGYAVIMPTTPPPGDVAEEGAPALREDGYYDQTWVVRDFTPEELEDRFESRRWENIQTASVVVESDIAQGYTIRYTSAETEETVFLAIPLTPEHQVRLQGLRQRIPEGFQTIRFYGFSTDFLDVPVADIPAILDGVQDHLEKTRLAWSTFNEATLQAKGPDLDALPEVPASFAPLFEDTPPVEEPEVEDPVESPGTED